MTTIAITTNGNITGSTWMNDNATQTSTIVRACDIAEICDMGEEEMNEYNDLDALNADLYDFTFSESPEFAIA